LVQNYTGVLELTQREKLQHALQLRKCWQGDEKKVKQPSDELRQQIKLIQQDNQELYDEDKN
jgi:hypothetical protein